MESVVMKLVRMSAASVSVVALAIMVGLATPSTMRADEINPVAKELFKAMSDYLAAQKTLSFEYDANLEVVAADQQKLALVSSGAVTLSRPDKIHATRSSGFANVELLFDGKVLTLVGKDANLYTQVDMPGTIEHLVDELRDKFNKPLPAADLLLANPYDQLMPDVVDAKDLGSGIVGGKECDHLAFRTKEVDWQIWIAQGEHPYPCRFVITSKLIEGLPQYSIQTRDWKTGSEVASDDFGFKNSTNASKIDLKDITDMDDLPSHFKVGGAQ